LARIVLYNGAALISSRSDQMASRTVLKKVDISEFISYEEIGRDFHRTGLCQYCESRFACSLTHDNGFIYECEDYKATRDIAPILSFSTIGIEPEEAEEEILSGLCAQCQRRDLCPLKYINGGVWHCEEFQ